MSFIAVYGSSNGWRKRVGSGLLENGRKGRVS